MLQESIGPIFAFDNRQADIPTETDAANDEVWQALADSRISLSFSALLKLVPRFIDKVVVNFTNPAQVSTIMDEHNPSIKVIVQGQDLPGSIVDGGSGINVINKLTYDRLGIQWETYPFWLRMVDTSIVRPIGLIRQLDVIIGGHTFQISSVVLKLQAQGAYPLLLGRS